MLTENFVIRLGKVAIALAWADHDLDHEEINCLKDLLFELPEVTEDAWKQLEIYMDHPVNEDERNRLLSELLDSIESKEEKDLALQVLENLIASDGKITESEKIVFAEIQEAIESKRTDPFSKLFGLMGGAIAGRRNKSAPNREEQMEDYLKNKVYFTVSSRLQSENISSTLDEENLRKVCLAAGLMSLLSSSDLDLSTEEQSQIQKILEKVWNLSPQEAALIAEVSVKHAKDNLDLITIARRFVEWTSYEERQQLVIQLFQIANASENVSSAEIERIRTISQALKISHSDFIQAKLTISREDRGGL